VDAAITGEQQNIADCRASHRADAQATDEAGNHEGVDLRRTAEPLAFGEEIPEQLADANNNGLPIHRSLSFAKP
jgi:hypothetical protein